ncbi:MAG: glycosyltransferase family 39 protein [Thermoguttaceae bacterium]
MTRSENSVNLHVNLSPQDTNEIRWNAAKFWTFTTFFCVVWTILPSFVMPGYSLDVPEMSFIGKEWVLGYCKHPTFHTWVIGVVEILTNRAHFAPFLASQLCVFLCLWASWRIARMLFTEEIAIFGTFSMFGYYYYTYQSTEYNNHLPLMACVSLALYFTICAFEENKLKWWFASGAAIGCGMLCKYPMILLAFMIVVFMLFNRKARTFWKFPGPYISIFVAIIVFFPHVFWLFQNNFAPFQYAAKHTSTSISISSHVVSIIGFIFGNFLTLIPIIVCLLPLTSFRWKPHLETEKSRFYFYFLLTSTVGVFFLFLLISILKHTDLTVAFASQIWPLFGVFWAFGIPKTITTAQKRQAARSIVCVALLMIIVLLLAAYIVPFCKNKPTRFLFPGKELAQIAEKKWSEYYGENVPCQYVTGEWWLAGNAAMWMRSNPHVLAYMSHDSMNDPKLLSSWSTRDDVIKNGGLVFWISDRKEYVDGIPSSLFQNYPNAVILPNVSLKYHRTTNRTANIGIAIVPPAHLPTLPIPTNRKSESPD